MHDSAVATDRIVCVIVGNEDCQKHVRSSWSVATQSHRCNMFAARYSHCQIIWKYGRCCPSAVVRCWVILVFSVWWGLCSAMPLDPGLHRSGPPCVAAIAALVQDAPSAPQLHHLSSWFGLLCHWSFLHLSSRSMGLVVWVVMSLLYYITEQHNKADDGAYDDMFTSLWWTLLNLTGLGWDLCGCRPPAPTWQALADTRNTEVSPPHPHNVMMCTVAQTPPLCHVLTCEGAGTPSLCPLHLPLPHNLEGARHHSRPRPWRGGKKVGGRGFFECPEGGRGGAGGLEKGLKPQGPHIKAVR